MRQGNKKIGVKEFFALSCEKIKMEKIKMEKTEKKDVFVITKKDVIKSLDKLDSRENEFSKKQFSSLIKSKNDLIDALLDL